MIGYTETDTIKMYVEEYENLARDLRFENEGMSEDTVILIQERMYTVDTILRNEHNFAIGKDSL
jgi:antitoxin component HigA of HigAB toxin-antitoxin module